MSTTDNVTLPYRCPQHPEAMVNHTWDEIHTVLNGYPSIHKVASNHHYYCAECGAELAPPRQPVGLGGEG